MVRIKKVNIYDSPILAVTKNSTTVYLVLDYGATSSLITMRKATELGLRINHTYHTAVQVDGESPLRILGEVHTTFYRGNTPLTFSALVVEDMPTDVLAGTNFHRENDVYARMAKDRIHIGDNITVMSTPATILEMDRMDTRARLVANLKKVTVSPGETISLPVPEDIPLNCEVHVEPNLQQVGPFFESKILQVKDGHIEIENESMEYLNLKKNCKPVTLRKVVQGPVAPQKYSPPPPKLPDPLPFEKVEEKMKINENKTMGADQVKKIDSLIKDNLAVFQDDLPGYNGFYGKLNAEINFASKARPVPQRIRSPAYTLAAQRLHNEKAQEMLAQGVLKRP